ncbi:MAG: transcription termination/antitermination protein NusG [Bacteroidales bacterium]|jgi:transcriptional antiterminator NusG
MPEKDDNLHKWYVIRTFTGQEKKVKELLEIEIDKNNLRSYIPRVLVPVEKVYQIRKGKRITKEKNYFPGYVLIEAILDAEIINTIKSIPSVLGFLGDKDNPTPMRSSEVHRILSKVDELNDKGEEIELSFLVGENVRIVDGPFSSFVGTVEEINEEKKKLKVGVKIFGRKTLLELSYMQVEKES